MSAQDGSSTRPTADAPGVVEILDEVTTIADEWDALADRVGADPFCRPGWFAAWMRAFTPQGRLGALTLRADGRLRAVVPLLRHRSITSSPTNEHTPRFRLLGEDPSAVAELATAIVRLRHRRLSLSPMDVEEATLEAILRAGTTAGYRIVERVALRSPYVVLEGIEQADAVLGRSMRKDLRRCRRRLEELGDLTVAVSRGGGELDALLDEALAVEERQW